MLRRGGRQNSEQILIDERTPPLACSQTNVQVSERMDVVHPRCCGLDIHKKLIVACAIVPDSSDRAHKQVRSFGTMSDDLQQLSEWLAEQGVTHVAMESTGSYWKPIFNVLEERFELLLVNAQHLKAVPGRKTDVNDAEWIADLLRHGLLKASYVPDRQQRELRELVRYRTSLIQERTAAANRLHKVLEGANVKLTSVATDVLGRSGREMLQALVAGQTDAALIAELARGRLREKRAALERALAGRFGAHQRLLVAEILTHIDFLDETIERLSAEIAERERPFEVALDHLDTIPGVGRRTAEIILAEVGPDVRRFPTAGHLVSWARTLPRPGRKRWQTSQWQDAKGQSLGAHGIGPSRAGRDADQNLSSRPVPTPVHTPRTQESRGGRSAFHPRHRVPPTRRSPSVRRSRRGVLRPAPAR
jgi:transposase